MPPGEIVIRRAYTFNETQALARDLEEQRLQRDMQTDAIAQIVRRLQAAQEAGLNGIARTMIMQVRADALAEQLRRGVAALYVIHGDEPLLALEAGDAIRAAARAAGATEREVFVVEAGFRWDTFLAANLNRGLFGERKLVDLRIPSGKPGVEGGKALEAYAANPNPDNVTLVTLPRLDRAAQSSAWFEALAGAGVTVAVYPVERDALPAWIAARMKRHRQRAARGNAGVPRRPLRRQPAGRAPGDRKAGAPVAGRRARAGRRRGGHRQRRALRRVPAVRILAGRRCDARAAHPGRDASRGRRADCRDLATRRGRARHCRRACDGARRHADRVGDSQRARVGQAPECAGTRGESCRAGIHRAAAVLAGDSSMRCPRGSAAAMPGTRSRTPR